jgi:hypothetical protein
VLFQGDCNATDGSAIDASNWSVHSVRLFAFSCLTFNHNHTLEVTRTLTQISSSMGCVVRDGPLQGVFDYLAFPTPPDSRRGSSMLVPKRLHHAGLHQVGNKRGPRAATGKKAASLRHFPTCMRHILVVPHL